MADATSNKAILVTKKYFGSPVKAPSCTFETTWSDGLDTTEATTSGKVRLASRFEESGSGLTIRRRLKTCDVKASSDVEYEDSSVCMFHACSQLERITLPSGFCENVKNVAGMFSGCTRLGWISLPEGFGKNADCDQDEYLSDDAGLFSGCTELSVVHLPEGFFENAKVSSQQFMNCTGLKQISMPKGFSRNATAIRGTFCGCSGLTSITLNNDFGRNVSTSFSSIFKNCSSLTELKIPDSVFADATKSEECSFTSLFEGCSSLKKLTLPKGFGSKCVGSPNTTTSSIYTYFMFNGCKSLQTIEGDLSLKYSFSLAECESLNEASVVNVLNSLPDVSDVAQAEGGDPVTGEKIFRSITLPSKWNTILSDSEKRIAKDKNWHISYSTR